MDRINRYACPNADGNYCRESCCKTSNKQRRLDRYALQSQQRWKTANDAGYFDNEMAPVEVKTRKGKQTMQVDEHPRPQTTMEQLNKLPPVFKKEGTVTAGNASGVSDGAGAVIIASEDAVKNITSHHWQELWAILCLDVIPLSWVLVLSLLSVEH